MVCGLGPCEVCGGRGWKFVSYRRSVARVGDAGERVLQTRARSMCLTCGGSGSSSTASAG
jgi:hypothetical protein